MKSNVGGMDRMIRILAGAALLAAGFMAGLATPWNYVAIAAGGIFVLTGLVKFCLLYTILGINSCPMKK